MKQLFSYGIVRYLFIGGVSFLVEISFLFLLVHVIKLNSIAGVAISFWIGLVLSFVLQKIITFRDNRKSVKHLARQTALYVLLVLVNYIFTITFVWMLESSLDAIISRSIAIVITTGWNYIIYSKLIFQKK